MSYQNKMDLSFLSLNENEGFSRLAVASFCSCINLSVEDVEDIKTAVSEAVTNAVVHGYPNNVGIVRIHCEIEDKRIQISVEDSGVGIIDVNKAKEPFFTTKKESERSGMGFTVMESFMDEMEVVSTVGNGTKVTLVKIIK